MDTLKDTFDALRRKAEALGPGEYMRCGMLLIERTRSTERLRLGSDTINGGPAHTTFWRGDFEANLREYVTLNADWTKTGHWAHRFVREALS